jgi:hypothetical protein
MVLRLIAWMVLGLVALRAAAANEPARVIPCQGQPFEATLIEISSDWQLTWEENGSRRTTPAHDVVSWGSWSDSDDRPQLLLGDAGVLVADLIGVREDGLEIESGLWRRTTLRRGAIRGIVFHVPIDAADRDRVNHRVLSHSGPDDRLWLVNGDELIGRLVATPSEPQTPLFGPVSLRFSLVGTTAPLTIDVADLVAVALGRSGQAAAPGEIRAHIGFRDGSCLPVTHVTSDASGTAWHVKGGAVLNANTSSCYERLTMIQVYGPRATYLSDLTPVDFKHVPFLDVPRRFGRDRNVLGGRLRAGGRVYLKGLGTYATSLLTFDLEPDQRRFAAELALDDSAGRLGSVTYRILIESPSGEAGAGGWSLAWESAVVRAGAEPLAVTLDLRGATRLALVVDFADRGDVQDHANWLNARLMK